MKTEVSNMQATKTMTMGTLVVVALVALASSAGAHTWGGYLRDDCGGDAPLVAVCTTGAHFRFVDEPTLRHGFSGVAGDFTGTMESRLTYHSGERVFACEYEDGSIVNDSCSGSGDFPPLQTYYVQTCTSQEAGVSMPGGSGEWGCFVEHGP